MDLTYGYLPIVTKARNDDGTLMVSGKCAGPDLDGDQQVLNEKWLATALPVWFETGANVREQHGKVAAGVGKNLTQDGNDWMLDSLAVDPVTVSKLEAGVLQGYSVGIKDAKVIKSARAPKGEIVGGRVVEISYVDRACNETCKLDIAKAAGSDNEWELTPTPAIEILTKALAANPLTAKADEMPLIKTAIDAICALIQEEAAELPSDFSEAYDIELLLEALYCLRSFWWCESDEGEVPSPVAVEEAAEGETVELTDLAEVAKAAAADDATDEDKQLLNDLRKALGVETLDPETFISKADHESAVAEAIKAATSPLEERLAEVEKRATPDGPVKSRTAQQAASAGAREQHLEKAERFERMADEVDDRELAKGYRASATAERDAAERILEK